MTPGIHNLWAVFGRSRRTEQDEWAQSYWRYHSIMALIAGERSRTLEQVAGVFAALSPNNDYLGNIRDAVTVLDAQAAGKGEADFKVSTYGNNKRKALLIAQGRNPRDEITALKTRAFFENIVDPENPDFVTIDGHMYWAWIGRKGRVVSPGDRSEGAKMTPRLYLEIARAIREIATRHGFTPCGTQAILWHEWRKMHGVLSSQQTAFIPDDVARATGKCEIELSTTAR